MGTNTGSQTDFILNSFTGSVMAIDSFYALSMFNKALLNVNLNEHQSQSIYNRMINASLPSLCDVNGNTLVDRSNFEIASNSEKGVARLNLKGTMLADGGICSRGIDVLCEEIKSVANNSTLLGAAIVTNTGGGEVVAAQRVSNALKEARKIKPFVQFVDGMSASGGYWVGANCDAIVMGGETTQVGSIGVVIDVDKDLIKFIKENYISILADGSEDKREMQKALVDEDYGFIRKKYLNPTREIFHKTVKQGRKDIDTSVLTGSMYNAKEAVNLKMADKIGTFEDAVKLVAKLSRQKAAAKLLK